MSGTVTDTSRRGRGLRGQRRLHSVALVTGFALLLAVALGLAMTLAFVVATVVNLQRGRDVACGCFGDLAERISARGLARLGLLLAALVSLGLLVLTGAADAVTPAMLADAGSAAARYVVDAAALAAAGLVVAALALAGPELADVLRRLRTSEGQA